MRRILEASEFNFTPLIAAALLYLCVTIRMTRIVDRSQVRSLRARGRCGVRTALMAAAVLELRGGTKDRPRVLTRPRALLLDEVTTARLTRSWWGRCWA